MKIVTIELQPDLSHCIETLSKIEYERTLNLLLKKTPIDEELGERLETLRLFLESTDFAYLRGKYEEYLIKGKKVKFIIYNTDGKVDYKIIIE
jgi:hypothetical protein